MKIKDGYNSKESEIKIGAGGEYSNNFELWIIQSGLPVNNETLSYILP